MLGLPDCYNTVNNDSFANPLTWDVMASGNYNENSHRPPLFSVYQRYFCNWVQPIELKTPTDVSMGYATDPESYDDVYIIKTTKYKEYYLLANRQKVGWDAGLAGNVMLVWHIDYDPVVWKNNEVNDDDTHQRIDIVEAGNKTYSSRLNQKRYPFPGAGKVTSFTDDTTPSMITWTGARLNKPITNIVEKDKTIYFAFMGGAGVDDVRAAGAEVSVGNGVINVNCENGVNVTICDAMGRVVTTGEVAGEHSFSVNPGLYIVRAGNEVCKLVVR